MKQKKFIIIILILFTSALIFRKISLPNRPQLIISDPIQTQVAMPTNFPPSYQIKTAFIPQAPEKNWDQPWQDTCEEAALLTLHYYYKHTVPNISQIKQAILDMLEFEQQQGWSHDINLTQMATISSQYLALHPQIIDNPTVDIIKSFISQDIPVIIPANGKTLYLENRNFRQGGPYYHNLTILGYNDKTRQFTVHDVGTQHGSYFKYSYKVLMDSIHDFPPSNYKEDINEGVPRILVLIQ